MGQQENAVEEPTTCQEPITGQGQATGEESKTNEASETHEKPKTDEEMRRSPRLQCSGLAGIQKLPATEKPCPAKIIDLSVGGCLMETERPLGLAADEIVELIFCVNHMPFRVRGQARAFRTETLVGFQFPQLSDRIRRQLEDLVGELIEHLRKLHKESLLNHPPTEDGKQPPARPMPSALNRQPQKPAPVIRGVAVHQPQPVRRWF